MNLTMEEMRLPRGNQIGVENEMNSMGGFISNNIIK